MKILAVDTSSKICAVAILEDNKVIDEIKLDNGKTDSENLMPIIKEILDRNNLNLSNFNLIAASVGPGSFTGIRIGIATIKPMAEVYNLPVASITSLETLARNIENKEKDFTIISLIDAKNNQVYAGFFDTEYNLKEDEFAEDIDEVLKRAGKYPKIIFVGDGAIIHKEKIEENMKNRNIIFTEENKQSAINTGKMGYKKFLEKNLKNSDTILPIYLRKSQAERLKNK